MWNKIKNFDNYEVSDEGKVRKIDTQKELKSQKNVRNGYEYVTLFYLSNGERKRKYCTVHRLVAEAFLPNSDNKTDVNHKDHDKSNNHVSNLEWVSRSENIQYDYDTDHRDVQRENAKCIQHYAAEAQRKITIQYDLNMNELARYESLAMAAQAVNGHEANIAAACRGERITAHGYKWRYEDTINVTEKKDGRTHIVQQFDLNNNFIQEFHSLSAAERANGFAPGALSHALKRDNQFHNFIWIKKS